MSLGIYNTLKKLILETVAVDKMDSAMDRRLVVTIYYDGDEKVAAGYREIEPYLRGDNKNGNEVVRAWVVRGATATEIPGWKTFRTDRIKTWNNSLQSFGTPINDRDSKASSQPYTNDGTDKLVPNVKKYIQF